MIYQTKIEGEPEGLGCPKGGSNVLLMKAYAMLVDKKVKRDEQKES